ncbi:hypothetical protein QUF74_00105 [Candidatus Halobeggiatoa sp. HSG11]|nr:hypothetical protein [Candidatus Halobeggiatoa sp. HSG11]
MNELIPFLRDAYNLVAQVHNKVPTETLEKAMDAIKIAINEQQKIDQEMMNSDSIKKDIEKMKKVFKSI